jgi:hypothetical protein
MEAYQPLLIATVAGIAVSALSLVVTGAMLVARL